MIRFLLKTFYLQWPFRKSKTPIYMFHKKSLGTKFIKQICSRWGLALSCSVQTVFLYLHYPYFVWFAPRLIQNFLKSVSNIVIPFLSIKGATYANLLKISMTHNKKWIPLLYIPIHCISAWSTSQILSLKDEYTFRFPNFLIIGLCNFFANC